MQYLRVKWAHSHPDEPVEIWSELDDARWEVRKVEVFPDGSVGYASDTECAHATVLGEAPVPALDDIAADPQFKPAMVSKNDFEAIWARRHASSPRASSAPPLD
jgi:hypothetical protein